MKIVKGEEVIVVMLLLEMCAIDVGTVDAIQN